ncbi:CASP-like protein 1C1 [Carya illinoinensis]|uniref:CASP-like protein 1C1 n=1 Tax=Carya illinoinensis TaxID=32201 RepID=UPI001C71A89F|nr:CASP-like protein 1C1 [Carya illinoinensis]
MHAWYRYFVIAEAIASGYSLIVLFVSSKSSLLWCLVVILDVVITMLLTSSFSAALAIAHVGKKGNSHAGWLPICGQVPKFCYHAIGALIAGCIAVIIYLVLLIYTFTACSVLGPPFKP